MITFYNSNMFKTPRHGFTLIELLVVLSIISLLSSVVLSSINSAREEAQITRTQEDLRQLFTAITLYEIDNQAYPPGSDLYTVPSNCESANWSTASNALVSGGYLETDILTDQ